MTARQHRATSARVFISYRRDDTAGYARALNDALARRFGADAVFIDVDDIAAGQAFDQTITSALGQARVLLVLIGPRWLASQASGLPRLHDPADFVHRELAAGLQAGIVVLPLLFDGAAMPAEAALPPPLQPLARRQALVMDARRFGDDTERLLAAVRQALGDAAPAPPDGPARRPWLLAGAAAALLAAGGAWWAGRPAPTPSVAPTAAPPAAASAPATAAPVARPAINGTWRAQVRYDWPGADFEETLRLAGEGRTLSGSASFLRVPRGIEGGVVDADGLRFDTTSTETAGGSERTVRHRYSGRLVGDELRLVLQTEGAAQPHQPVEVVARRTPGP